MSLHQRMATGMAQNQGSQWIPRLNGSKMDCAMAMGSDPVTGASMDGVVCHHGPATVCPEA
jgi:hypothetical protein